MQFTTYQVCRSTEGWQPIEVPSSSSDKTYIVLVNPWGEMSANICSCESYTFRGHCRHQGEAQDKLCGWNSKESKELKIIYSKDAIFTSCPKCGGSIKTEIEVL